MRSMVKSVFFATISLVSLLYIGVALFAEPPGESKNKVSLEKKNTVSLEKKNTVSLEKKSSSRKKRDRIPRISVKAARERAKLTHSIYVATLDMIHHQYFSKDRSTVPARVMEDVFDDIARQEHIKAKWITVNAKVMSIDHKPESDFEKQAAKEIAAGKGEYELVKEGIYQRAVGISLMNRGCLGCHMGFGANSKKDRFAGLVISIPVEEK